MEATRFQTETLPSDGPILTTCRARLTFGLGQYAGRCARHAKLCSVSFMQMTDIMPKAGSD